MQTLEPKTGSHRFLLKKDTHEIGLILGRFRENTGCRTALLIDEAGHLIAKKGNEPTPDRKSVVRERV